MKINQPYDQYCVLKNIKISQESSNVDWRYILRFLFYIYFTLILFSIVYAEKDSFASSFVPPPNPTDFVKINGTDITMNYNIIGGKLLSVIPSVQSKSITLLLQSTNDGNLTVKLPRTLIDARENGDETHLVVKVDNHGTNYDAVEDSMYRTLTIPFHHGAEKITITGTQISLQNVNSKENIGSMTDLNESEIIKAPFTQNPPIIDGKWTTPNEWDNTHAMTVEQNGTKMYIIAEHDHDFIYVMADIITDHITTSSSNIVGNNLLMIFDIDNYTGYSLTSKNIGVGTSHLFVNGTKRSNGFGSDVWTYDNQSRSIDIKSPLGYASNASLSSVNDPFDSVHDHRTYEFKIPISLVHVSNTYGFSLKSQTCLGNEVNLCHPAYTVFWPLSSTMSIPSTHGLLELTYETNPGQSSESAPSNDFEIIIVVSVIIVSIVIYFVRIKKRKSDITGKNPF